MRKIVLLLIALVMVIPVYGQANNSEDVEMTAFTAAPLDIQGLRPAGWLVQENTFGVFLRAADPFDPTAIIMQSQEIEQDAFLVDLPELLQLEDDLQATDQVESDYFTWDVYQATRIRGEQELLVDLAVAYDEDNGRTYFVMLQSTEFFYDNLHTGVFMVALEWVSPLQKYTDDNETYTVPVPVQWEATTVDDAYGQLTNPDDTVAVFVDAIEGEDAIVASQNFLAQINPEFDITFDEEIHNLAVLEDDARIGDLDAVTIIFWDDGQNERGFLLQTVAREYDGVIYLTAIVTTLEAVEANEESIIAIDNGFTVTALEDAMDAEEDTEESDDA